MYRITKRFAFSASHQLTHLPEGHQCARLHGHNYEVELELASEDLNPDQFVIDYGELSGFKRIMDEELDHRHLNSFMTHPTAELLACWLYNRAAALYGSLVTACRVMETPKTCAEFRP